MIEGDAIAPFLDVTTNTEKMRAGNWNPDFTREHDYFESEVVVEVRPHAGAWADLVVHASAKKAASIVYRWDATLRAYVSR